jgi:UDP-N-acetyl-D-mannosaminuronic acid transferase (WecB/TagA/CpsF family)
VVGLSTPKQERFIAAYCHLLPVKLMVGVGASFDLLSGNLAEAPDWIKKAGLQWLYRLFKEPKRLWRRYLLNHLAYCSAAHWPERVSAQLTGMACSIRCKVPILTICYSLITSF